MKVKRISAVLALVTASAVVAMTPAHAGDAGTRRDPALVKITGASASLVGVGESRRLVIIGVSPDATFDASRTPPADIGTYGAVALLDTATAPAVLRGTTDGETEGLVLSSFSYDEATATLEADAAAIDGVIDLPVMEDAGGAANSDGVLPSGPVELIAGDTDTRVAASGAPQAPQGDSPSYSVPMQIYYNTVTYKGQPHADATIEGEFLPSKSKCAVGKNFKGRPNWKNPIQTSFDVDTSFKCFFDVTVAVYKIHISGTAGPLHLPESDSELTITSVAPRTFVSGCPDTGAAEFQCGVRDIVVAPRVFMYVTTRQ